MESISTHTAARSFSEYMKAVGATSTHQERLDALEARLGARSSFVEKYQKAAVAALSGGSMPDLAWAPLAASFLELGRKQTILGRLIGTLPLPMRARVGLVAGEATGYWVGRGEPIPVSSLAFSSVTVEPTSLAALVVLTQELFEQTGDPGTSLLERQIQQATRNTEDSTLLDDQPAVAGLRPAGLLYGLTASGSGSPSEIEDDLRLLWLEVRGGQPERPYFIVSPEGAFHLASLRDSGGRIFPDVTISGGMLNGVPVIVAKAAGSRIVLIDAAALAVADDGLTIDRSTQASIQMLDDPTNSSTTATGTTLVSAFQTNSVILRLVRFLNWKLGYADAVAFADLQTGSPA